MARIFQEFLEATGYDEAGWTETVPGTCVVDEDYALGAGRPPLWGAQCLRIDLDGGGLDCHTYNLFGDGAVRFLAAEIYINNIDFTVDAEQASVFQLFNNALTATVLIIQLVRVSGVKRMRCIVYHNGSANFITDDVLTLQKVYRVELKWDETADTWELWLDNVSRGSGSLTGAAATTQMGAVICGDILNSVNTGIYLLDRVEVDDAERIVYRGMKLAGENGGLVGTVGQHQGRAG